MASEIDELHHQRVAATRWNKAELFSIVVESSGASPIVMTGVRDTAKQDRELVEIYGIDP